MSVMCSLALFKAQEGLCRHEEMTLSVAALLLAGMGAAGSSADRNI